MMVSQGILSKWYNAYLRGEDESSFTDKDWEEVEKMMDVNEVIDFIQCYGDPGQISYLLPDDKAVELEITAFVAPCGYTPEWFGVFNSADGSNDLIQTFDTKKEASDAVKEILDYYLDKEALDNI